MTSFTQYSCLFTEMFAGSPSLLCLDEPTSGLDSTAANALVQTLRELADSGKTVIAVIHQPNQHVFSKFDDVLLVSEGKQMYFGPRQEVRSYMEQHGCEALPEMGTAEHILDCISRQTIGEETDEEVNERMERLATRAREAKLSLGTRLTNGNGGIVQRLSGRGVHGPRANLFVQFRLLLKRALCEVFRGKLTIVLGFVRQISTALIYGGIYHLGTNQASIQDRFGLLSLIAIGAMNMAVAQTIRAFPREKAIVSNELASNMYRTLPYFIGKAVSELPMVGVFNGIFGIVVYKLTGLSNMPGKLWNFLGLLTVHGVLSQAAGLLIGSFSPNSDVALAIFPAVVVLNIIFDVSLDCRLV
jgi:ABC-2 type transporter